MFGVGELGGGGGESAFEGGGLLLEVGGHGEKKQRWFDREGWGFVGWFEREKDEVRIRGQSG